MLEAANKLVHHWVEDSHPDDLRPTVSAQTESEMEVVVTRSPQNGNAPEVRPKSWPAVRARNVHPGPIAPSTLFPHYTFDQFIVGSSNQFAQPMREALTATSSIHASSWGCPAVGE